MSYQDVRMVKALCGNLKTAFDSAKVNFLEAREAIQIFYRLLKKLENLEKNPQNGEDVVAMKRMTTNITQSVAFLRTKLTRNSDTAEEGFKLLQNRMTKVNEFLEELSIKKRKYEVEYNSYKRLRTGLHSSPIIIKDERLSDRQRKVDALQKAIASTNVSLASVNMEKEALSETSKKMEDFLDGTKDFIQQLRNKRIVISKQGVLLSKWCNEVRMKFAPLMDIRNHVVDGNTIVFEFSNPPDYPSSAPRLIMTARFMKYQHGLHPYALMHAEVNHNSVDVFEALEYAIQRNDLAHLLIRVRDSWQKHFVLLHEVISLRERFPIDWQVEEGKLCVLLGERVNVNCTLKVPKEYPGLGCISIDRIEGVSADLKIDEIKPDGEQSPSLVRWVEYLADRFHKV